MILGERLAKVRKQLGVSQANLAAAMGNNYTQSMISNVESGRRGLLAESLVQASSVLGVSVDYLLGLTDNPRRQLGLELAESDDSYDIVNVPELSGVVPSRKGLDTTIRTTETLPRKLLLSRGIDPRSCFLVRFQGDSMLNEYPEDCRLLVDRRSLLPVDQKVYLLDTPKGAVVKRVHPWQPGDPVDDNWARGGGDPIWVVRSDNRVVDAEPLIGQVKIIGEIKWLDHSS